MIIEIDQDYKISISCEKLDVEDMNRQLRFLAKWIKIQIGEHELLDFKGFIGSEKEGKIYNPINKTIPSSENQENKYRQKLTKKDGKDIRRIFKNKCDLMIPEGLRDKEKERREAFIKKQLAKKYKVKVSAISYRLKNV